MSKKMFEISLLVPSEKLGDVIPYVDDYLISMNLQQLVATKRREVKPKVSGTVKLRLSNPDKLKSGGANQALLKVMQLANNQTRSTITMALESELPKIGLRPTTAIPTISSAIRTGGLVILNSH